MNKNGQGIEAALLGSAYQNNSKKGSIRFSSETFSCVKKKKNIQLMVFVKTLSPPFFFLIKRRESLPFPLLEMIEFTERHCKLYHFCLHLLSLISVTSQFSLFSFILNISQLWTCMHFVSFVTAMSLLKWMDFHQQMVCLSHVSPTPCLHARMHQIPQTP